MLTIIKRKFTTITLTAGLLIAMVNMQSCETNGLLLAVNNANLLPKISDYHIFQGNIAELKPADDFKQYELSTGLFTDYAEKQRLIKVPAGYKLTALNDGLPDFPDGTVLVKTFYYFNNKRDELKRKRIIETRVLIKINSIWSAGTYKWNQAQTEAFLITKGSKTDIAWIDKKRVNRLVSYHVPATKECATCHNSNKILMPIGFKIRNLNMEVKRQDKAVNQLSYFSEAGILNGVDKSLFTTLPNWQNNSQSLEKRARAYMDINCAHCHSENGYCSNSALRLGYEIAFTHTQIAKQASRIDKFMSKKRMPMLGTTIIDEEGLSLVKAYIRSLK